MALIGKIRRNLWFMLILLGLALAAFVIMDMTSASNLGGPASQLTIGEINGEKIDYREFQNTEQILYSGASSEVFSRRNSLWNYFIEETLVEQEAEELGLGVGIEELIELQFGQNLSPIIQQNFINPQTRQVDRAQLSQIQTAIQNNDLNPQFRRYWAEQEKQIIKTQLQSKLSNMVTKSMYMPSWMAEMSHSDQNKKVDFAYVKVPFDAIDDSEVNLTDEDYSAFIEANRRDYTTEEETRIVDYISHDVIPTAADTAAVKQEIERLIEGFIATDNDSLYSLNNNGFYSPFYNNPIELDPNIEEGLRGLDEGEVYGPFIEGSNYRAVKLIEKRVIPDSVKARHILKRATPGNITELTTAENLIDSLKTVLERRQETFDSLAFKFSDDQVSKLRGGELGTFVQGAMVPAFNNVCFVTGSERGYYVTKTQFGVHLIDIQDQIFLNRNPKYKLAFIEVPIIPSQATQDSVFEILDELVTENSSLESLSNSLSEIDDQSLEQSAPLKQNDFEFGDLGPGQTARDIIRWAYDPGTDPGDVSPEVYTFTDQVNYFDSKYIAVALKEIVKPGLQSVNNIKGEISSLVMNEKKGSKIAADISSTDLSALADQFEIEIDTASGISFVSRFIPGVGEEAKVVGEAFRLDSLGVSKPIIGKSGVFVIQQVRKSEPTVAASIPQIRSLNAMSTNSKVNAGLLESMKKNAKIKDKRFTFF